jgi:hypothetical protein
MAIVLDWFQLEPKEGQVEWANRNQGFSPPFSPRWLLLYLWLMVSLQMNKAKALTNFLKFIDEKQRNRIIVWIFKLRFWFEQRRHFKNQNFADSFTFKIQRRANIFVTVILKSHNKNKRREKRYSELCRNKETLFTGVVPTPTQSEALHLKSMRATK